jgi:hypothetical protein
VPDGCRVEDDLSPLKRHTAGGFREPLVKADEDGNLPVAGLVHPVAVARVEVPLLVKTGVLRDMHLPVRGQDGAVGIDHDCRVVKPPILCLLKDRDNDDNFVVAGDGREDP